MAACCIVLAHLALGLRPTSSHPPIAMGTNGHAFTQPNYMQGPLFVADGSAAGITYEQQLGEVAAVAPGGRGRPGHAPFYYRLDIGCSAFVGVDSNGLQNQTLAAERTAVLTRFLEAAAARNLEILPILFPSISPHTAYNDTAAVTSDAEASTYPCAKIFTDAGVSVFEVGQEWDNLALLPGRGGAHESDYNMTIYNHLLAELRGLAAGVRRAAASSSPLVNINRRGDGGTNSSARTDGTGSGVQIGVNTGGWIHFKFLQMLIADKLDFDIVAYHWYSDMVDINNAGGYNVWAELVGMGKDIWITELDRRGGSSALPVKSDPDNQPTYLNHEIALLVNLSTSSAAAANGWFPLKAILTYELYDEPQQGNAFPKTCTSGNASVNGESCYGLVETAWHPGSGCDQYHSCNFTAGVRKPAWTVLQAWAEKLG